MMINDENKKSGGRLKAGRAVYIALGVCVLAAGLIGYMSSLKLPDVDTDGTQPKITYEQRTDTTYRSEKVTVDINVPPAEIAAQPAEETAYETEAAQTEETVPDVRAVFGNENESLTEAADTAPVKYQLPLSADMGKDYSMGVPVFSATMSDYRTHNGVDFVGKPGDAVKPIASGRVIAVENDTVRGNVVTIDHGGGVVSSVWGLADEGIAAEGVEVIEESVIGTLGTVPCELRDGDHIHLEVRVNGELADPLEVMGLAENPTE